MKARWPFKLVMLATICFTLATIAQNHALKLGKLAQSDNVLKMFLGDGRKVLAEQFSRKADIYFHSGYYPSFFDQANKPNRSQSPMVSGEEEHHHDGDEPNDAHHEEDEHEKTMAFLDKPLDWIEAVGRQFMVTEHTHLQGGREREILPWLQLSASLDPQNVETYTVAAYWLRKKVGKAKEAEEFLRDGLRANPNSPDILFELGSLYEESKHDTTRARNVWELALRRWRETEPKKEEPNIKLLGKIAGNLGKLEEEAGNWDKAIYYLELCKEVSPHPEDLEQQIQQIKQKKTAQPSSAAP